jgi:hypothetical protein
MTSCEKYSFDGVYENGLIGKWEWIESCGGLIGGCWYPTIDDKEQIEFTSNHRYLRTLNGTRIFNEPYTLGDSYQSGNLKYYEISFNTKWSSVFWFDDKETLEMVGGDFVEKFKRIK